MIDPIEDELDELELQLPTWIRIVPGLGNLTPIHLIVIGFLIGLMTGMLTYPLNL